MIKKSVFEDELIAGMQRELGAKRIKQGMQDLDKAVDYLQSAVDIFEDAGMKTAANHILGILIKIANEPDNQDAKSKPHKPKNPTRISDSHTKGLTPEKMVENLKHHGIVFNLADDNAADAEALLNNEINDTLEVSDQDLNISEMDFEDEI